MMELQELELCFVHHNRTDLGLEQAKTKQTRKKKTYENKPDSAHTKSSASAKGIFKQCCKQVENSEHKGCNTRVMQGKKNGKLSLY